MLIWENLIVALAQAIGVHLMLFTAVLSRHSKMDPPLQAEHPFSSYCRFIWQIGVRFY